MRDSMSESEESFNILEWPLLMPVIFGIFLTECVVGGWVWTVLPEWRWLVYLIIAIDLLTLVVIYIMVVVLGCLSFLFIGWFCLKWRKFNNLT